MREDPDQGAPRPFFQTEQIGSRGRLLLISYHFPPGQATGALRWQKLSRFAAERGWSLDVVTLDPSSLPAPELERLDDLPPGVRIFGVREPLPLRVERLLDTAWRVYRRLHARWGDRRVSIADGESARPIPPERGRPTEIGRSEIRWTPPRARTTVRAYHAWTHFAAAGRWARGAAALALRIAHHGAPPSAVVSCGPPHMAHEAGRRLAQAIGTPFIMDLRDPWSLVPRLPESIASPLWYQLARRYERRAVARSTLIVANTEAARQAMQAIYPEAASKFVTVMNGFDDDPIPASVPGSRFLIAYAGSIYMDRDPRPLFRAVARLVQELRLGPDDIGIEFIGEVDRFNGTPVERLAEEEGIGEFVRLYPPVSRREAMEFMARATLLVDLPQDAGTAIPSKLFDYMRFNAWLLVLAHRGSAPALLVGGTAIDLAEPDDLEGIVALLRHRYRQHIEGQRPPRLADALPAYSRRAQAERLFDTIESHLGRGRSDDGVGALQLDAPAGERVAVRAAAPAFGDQCHGS